MLQGIDLPPQVVDFPDERDILLGQPSQSPTWGLLW